MEINKKINFSTDFGKYEIEGNKVRELINELVRYCLIVHNIYLVSTRKFGSNVTKERGLTLEYSCDENHYMNAFFIEIDGKRYGVYVQEVELNVLKNE